MWLSFRVAPKNAPTSGARGDVIRARRTFIRCTKVEMGLDKLCVKWFGCNFIGFGFIDVTVRRVLRGRRKKERKWKTRIDCNAVSNTSRQNLRHVVNHSRRALKFF